MISNGFACGYMKAVLLDTDFGTYSNGGTLVSSYIHNGGPDGDIVFKNVYGDAQVLLSAGQSYHPIAATQILTDAIIDGTLYVTGATSLSYCASNKA